MPRRCRGIRGDVGIAPTKEQRGRGGQRLSLRQRFALTPPSQREAGFPRLRARGTDSHASDIGHWLGMTTQKAGADNAIHLRQLRFEMR